VRPTFEELGNEELYQETLALEDQLDQAKNELMDERVKVALLRGRIAQKVQEQQSYVDTLNVILDDWAYYVERMQPEFLPDLQAQLELLAVDMKGSG
jgi:hypothetical protein